MISDATDLNGDVGWDEALVGIVHGDEDSVGPRTGDRQMPSVRELDARLQGAALKMCLLDDVLLRRALANGYLRWSHLRNDDLEAADALVGKRPYPPHLAFRLTTSA